MNVSLVVAKVLPPVKTRSAPLLALVPMDMFSIATALVVMISTNVLMIPLAMQTPIVVTFPVLLSVHVMEDMMAMVLPVLAQTLTNAQTLTLVQPMLRQVFKLILRDLSLSAFHSTSI